MTTDEPAHIPVDLYPFVCSMCGQTLFATALNPGANPNRMLDADMQGEIQRAILEHEKTCPRNT